MSIYSREKLPPLTLALQHTAKAAEFLTDFANTHPEDYERFEFKWGDEAPLAWVGGRESFQETQQTVRAIWEGRMQGYEDQLVANGLGLRVQRSDYKDSSLSSLIQVNWREGTLWAARRDLNDMVWLVLLAYSDRLGVCSNRENECPTPYFIKKKPNQKFCSEVCAAPAQRAFKRQWFREHGEEWRKKWLRKKKRSAKKSQGGKNGTQKTRTRKTR